jgi:hypothetical protein
MMFFDTTIASYKKNKNKLSSSISNQYDVKWWNWKFGRKYLKYQNKMKTVLCENS